MGEQFKSVQLIIIKPSGEQINIENANIIEIKESEEKNELDYYFGGSCERIAKEKENVLEFTVETKNLSKKRFIKLLMAKGIARNGARDLAEYIGKKYGNYNEKYLLLY